MSTTATTETFPQTVARLGRQHRQLLDDPTAGLAEWRRIFRRLHAAADLAGISHDEAGALLLDAINAGSAA